MKMNKEAGRTAHTGNPCARFGSETESAATPKRWCGLHKKMSRLFRLVNTAVYIFVGLIVVSSRPAIAEIAFTIIEENLSAAPTSGQYATTSLIGQVEEQDAVVISLQKCQNKSDSFVRIRNPDTGKSVRLTNLSGKRDRIRLTSLLIGELRQRSLGVSSHVMDCSLVEPGADGGEIVLERIAFKCRDVPLPQFRYGDGSNPRLTETNERTLRSVCLITPQLIFSDNTDDEQKVAANKYAEENLAVYSYEYELPNGDIIDYLEMNHNIAVNSSSSSTAGNFEITNLDGPMYYMGSEYAGEVSPMSDSMLAAMSFACKEWSKVLKLGVPIKIVTGLDESLPYNVIGSTYNSPSYYDKTKSCGFPYSLINQIKGYDIDESSADIYIVFNPIFPFYLGTDGKCPSTKQDFLSTALHELNHGLGFASNHRRIQQSDGSVTVDGSYNKGQPSIYDLFLYSAGQRLSDATQAQRKSAYTSNALYWDGTNAKAAYGGNRPKLYAPTKYNSGSSVSHWDNSNSFETFMTYASGLGDVCHEIDAITLGALKDMGYVLASDEKTFSISPSGNSFGASFNTGIFSVKSNTPWTAKTSDLWITLKTKEGSGNGSISYTVEANDTASERNGIITVIDSYGKEATHSIRQSAASAQLSIDPNTADYSDAAGSGHFSVLANYPWTVTASDPWIILNTPSGSGNGTVLYSVESNNSSRRVGTIMVTCGSLTARHTVTQAAQPQLSINPSAKTFSADSHVNETIAVESDSMWTVSKSASWIVLDKTSGVGNGTITYTVLKNTGSKREGWIYVTCGSVKRTHFITQNRADSVTFTAESANVSEDGGAGSFSVTILGNNRYVTTVASSDPWVSWTWVTESLSEGIRFTFTYNVDPNLTIKKRETSIPIVFNGIVYKFTITQNPQVYSYLVTYRPGTNGSGSEVYDIKQKNISLTLREATFSRTGYTQKGWATTDGGGKVYDLGASYTKNEAITLYPYWEKGTSGTTTYTLRFSPGPYGSGNEQTATKYKGVAFTLPGAMYTRDGFEQTGWSVFSSGTSKTYELGGTYGNDSATTFYPYWTERQKEEEPASCDIGFYSPSSYDQPMCLSATNLAYWAYAPQYVFNQGDGLILNYCVRNKSDADATLVDRIMSLWDVNLNMVESEIESYADTIPAGRGMLFPNRNLKSWMTSISPGNYALKVNLDPYGKLNDPDESDNVWTTWFAVKADGITLNEALDCSSLYFTDDGTSAFPQTSESVVGGSCVQLGPQPTNSWDSMLWAYVEEPGRLTFKWKATSQDYKAYLGCYVGGEMVTWKWATEESEWEEVSVEITTAQQWVCWRLGTYEPDASCLTAGWVDCVIWSGNDKKPTFTVDANGTLTAVELNGITDIEIPSMVNGVAVRNIGRMVFENTVITSVSIPETVTNICDSAFSKCADLRGITIPRSVRTIGKTAFYRCQKLKSIVLEEGLEKIEEGAFYNCQGLTYVKLPASVSEIGPTPFGHNINLMTIDVAKDNLRYGTVNYSLVDKSTMCLLQYPMGRKAQIYEVPDGIVGIDFASFNLATNIVEIIFPATLQRIGDCAFLGCSNLSTVKFLCNAPIIGGEQTFQNVASSCKAQVLPRSTGWGVTIPGTWNGIGIEYSISLQTYPIFYNQGVYGVGTHQSETKQYGIPLPLKGAIFIRTGYAQTGWSIRDGGAKTYELCASYTANESVTLYPYWTANTYNVSYDLGGGEMGVAMPTSVSYGTPFRVSAPTRDGYVFTGWMVSSGLDITTARYGESSTVQSKDIDNASMQCFNGSDVDVWFINLTPQLDGKVILTATWEPIVDDGRDIGFYAPANRGWTFPVCLSSTNIAHLAYAPETEFVQGMGVYLSFCAVNWSTVGPAMLQSTLLTITDESGAIFDQGEPIQRATIGAFGYWEIRNISMRRYLSGITPGRYKLTLELDPNRLLNDPDRSNNTTSIWFTVTAPSDPIPELPSDATAADVRVALAGSADERLAEYITDISTYSAYREWAQTVKDASGTTVAGKQKVKNSDKAWFSFAIDSQKLIENEIASDDVKIENFSLSSNGRQFDFTVAIKNVEFGASATMERLKSVLGVEGATILDDFAFSSDNLTIQAAEPENRKVKLTVNLTPARTGGDSIDKAFFMRVTVTP